MFTQVQTVCRKNFWLLVVIVSCLVLSVCFPLFTYGSSLALFGVAHVAYELRYVDERFGARISQRTTMILSLLLLGVAGIRAMLVFQILPSALAYNIELALVVFLSLAALLSVPKAKNRFYLPIFSVAAILVAGFSLSPALTILLLAVFHNLTPMGFMIEVLPRSIRKLAFFACTAVFILIPFFIAFGMFSAVFEPIIGIHPDASLLPMGPLAKHLGVYLPAAFRDQRWAAQIFSAIVFAQCMHYVAVINVMPRLLQKYTLPKDKRPFVKWPSKRRLLILVFLITGLLFVAYTTDFILARSIYGIAAVVHAYIEIPLLLMSLFLSESFAKPSHQRKLTSHLPQAI